MDVLGLDIGGANLKAAHSRGQALSVPFALWKTPDLLPDTVSRLLRDMPPYDALAVTMTGELCDCFESKRQGVLAILDAVTARAGQTPIHVWRNDGHFVDVTAARATPLQVASANWLALAVVLLLAGLLRRGPSPWTDALSIALVTWPVLPLAGILAFGKWT